MKLLAAGAIIATALYTALAWIIHQLGIIEWEWEEDDEA